MQQQMTGTAQLVYSRIEAGAPSGVWSRCDFLDLGSPHAVEKALQRLTTRGEIRRPSRGLYDKPALDPMTGKWVFPPPLSYVDAIARRDDRAFLVDEVTAAHDLGLTPFRPSLTTIHGNTHPRMLKINVARGYRNTTAPIIYKFAFKKSLTRTAFFWAGRPPMRVIQAFHWLLDERRDLETATRDILQKLKEHPDRQAIADDLRSNLSMLPDWLQPSMLQIAEAFPFQVGSSPDLVDGVRF